MNDYTEYQKKIYQRMMFSENKMTIIPYIPNVADTHRVIYDYLQNRILSEGNYGSDVVFTDSHQLAPFVESYPRHPLIRHIIDSGRLLNDEYAHLFYSLKHVTSGVTISTVNCYDEGENSSELFVELNRNTDNDISMKNLMLPSKEGFRIFIFGKNRLTCGAM